MRASDLLGPAATQAALRDRVDECSGGVGFCMMDALLEITVSDIEDKRDTHPLYASAAARTNRLLRLLCVC